MSNKGQLQLARESKCPFCTSYVTEYNNIEVDNGVAVQSAECMDCRSTWDEYYTLTEIVVTTDKGVSFLE